MLHELCKIGKEEALKGFLNEIGGESEERLQLLLSHKNDMKYTPLHVAIFER
jgi:hypothetical protein